MPTSDVITIEVDGKPMQARKGQMLIEVTDPAGVYIPRFCYHKKLSIAANCRMCLIEVEKAPKPLPACATPVMEGMKVFTRSEKARDAQKGTMEFLLINHPLDCPICDQGGECELQDLSVGYGKGISRYHEVKRIVADKDIGSLISTDMTRCIHCTRCVRFGQEVAGVMEFGGVGRGEHMEIRTFLDRSVDSELSGNVIDLCPVGALTSKPFRYSARPWELASRPSVSLHDCVGANLDIQHRRGRVMRALPRENEAVNECWLADRDRFSYEAVNSDERLQVPMIRRDGQWQEVDWQTALDFTVTGLRRVIETHGAAQFGALAASNSTLEEFYLLQKLARGLGSGNVDHRLRQTDFRDDAQAPAFPWLGQSLTDLERLKAVLLVGANPRKDQPLINLRLRKSQLKGAAVMAVNPLDVEFNYCTGPKIVTDPAGMVRALAGIGLALAGLQQADVPAELRPLVAGGRPTDTEQAIADVLFRSENPAVLLGSFAATHPQAATLRSLAELIADLCSAKLGYLPEANSTGAWIAGCVPQRGTPAGKHALAMLRESLKGYLLLGVEPELDCLDAPAARAAMEVAEFVVMLTTFRPSIYKSGAVEYADVWLPLAPFTETAGTHVNAEGRFQSFDEAVAALGQARPGWKILRMLGMQLGLPGFGYDRIEDVRADIALPPTPSARLRVWSLPSEILPAPARGQWQRIVEVPMYRVDALVRRAPSLQHTADNPPPAAHLNPVEADKLGLTHGDSVSVALGVGVAQLPLVVDARVPDGCVLIPCGWPETAVLGALGPAAIARMT
ncbi:MAG: NADH-quinone oxidoreductase subunit G [Gammaproteobacteria bacterium]|nr:NADH-quinone oxidoreductase subunit G [Gammaproteobacteria bacterium]